MESKTYSAPGKLLITGEYLVLFGAKALAVPVRFAQHLTIEPSATDTLNWKSYGQNGEEWFSAEFSIADWKVVKTSSQDTAMRLMHLLKTAGADKKIQSGVHATTRLDFPNEWGLGSSSTLTVLVANWLCCDAIDLHFKTSSGSGYDVAVAQRNSTVIYSLSESDSVMESVVWNPPFSQNIFFVYLNQKQVSENAVKDFRARFDATENKSKIEQISVLTQRIVECEDLEIFNQLIAEHERIMSEVLSIPTTQERLFADYRAGSVKSLGAWGGDFVMVTGTDEDMRYFIQKGYFTILSWNEMISSSDSLPAGVIHPGVVKK